MSRDSHDARKASSGPVLGSACSSKQQQYMHARCSYVEENTFTNYAHNKKTLQTQENAPLKIFTFEAIGLVRAGVNFVARTVCTGSRAFSPIEECPEASRARKYYNWKTDHQKQNCRYEWSPKVSAAPDGLPDRSLKAFHGRRHPADTMRTRP